MTSLPEFREWYRGKHVLVTGGLGFIGSNLALALCRLGAHVTVADSSVPGCGANPFNLGADESRIALVQGDIGDAELMAEPLRQADVVFNLAGEVSHTHSMLFPERDLRINTIAHLRFLEACSRHAPGRRVVYAGTRQVYGAPLQLPVDESHPVQPVDYNGVHKHAAENYHLLLTRIGQIDGMVLRLTNIYGPRMAIGLPCQGFLPAFFRRALEGNPIRVFGDGAQLRDPLFVDDVCESFLRAGAVVNPRRRTINIGSKASCSLLEIAAEISRQADLPGPETQPFPPARGKIDIGSYCSSETLSVATLGWRAHTSLAEGVRLTLDYYRAHHAEYLAVWGELAGCPLDHVVRAPAAALALQ
ncbi:MAG: NAD-dependent epimerase/dehydratase family protein [Acidobacteriota bacterium]